MVMLFFILFIIAGGYANDKRNYDFGEREFRQRENC